ncbi:MAG: hypothetical protein NVSMB9_28980 [Isosphaeraceae bacterium]
MARAKPQGLDPGPGSHLDAEHQTLRATIADLHLDRLSEIPIGGKVSHRALIQGIIMHDVYHAGQIQLLKRLRTS